MLKRAIGGVILGILWVVRWILELSVRLTIAVSDHINETLVGEKPKPRKIPTKEAKPAQPKLKLVANPTTPLKAGKMTQRAKLLAEGYEIETDMNKDGMCVLVREDGHKMLVHRDTWDVIADNFEQLEAQESGSGD